MEHTQGGKVCLQLTCVKREAEGKLLMTAMLLLNHLLSE